MNLKKSLKVSMAMREMSQDDLAEKMGIKRTGIAQMIMRNCVTTDTLVRMSSAVGMKVSEFVKLGED